MLGAGKDKAFKHGAFAAQKTEALDNMPSKFQLEGADIQEYWIGIYSQLLGATITLRHAPTGVEVKGDIPQVHHTKAALRNAENLLRKRLSEELTSAVAKHLRTPGR